MERVLLVLPAHTQRTQQFTQSYWQSYWGHKFKFLASYWGQTPLQGLGSDSPSSGRAARLATYLI
jgi:hypothetical protein